MSFPLLNKDELKWAAGFFDGEGTFAYYGDSILRASVAQKDDPEFGTEVLERFRQAVGFGNIYGPNKHGIRHFIVNGAYAQQVYALLYSYLGPVKRRQGRLALEKWKIPKKKWQQCLRIKHDIRVWGGKKTCKTCWDIKWKNR